MLIEFNLGNFWSFKEVQSLQMQAAKIRSKFPRVDANNIAAIDGQLSLLKSKAIYGANGSGKSNLLRGMKAMLAIIRDSLKDEQVLSKNITSFQLSEEAVNQPSFFQLSFLLNGHIFRYGFEADRERIASEWLFGKPLNASGKAYRERYFFTREGMVIQVNESRFPEGSRFARLDENNPPLYRSNTLFLSVLAAFNRPLSRSIARYFDEGLVVAPAYSDQCFWEQSLDRMKEEGFRQKLTSLLKGVDPTIEKLEKVEPEFTGLAAGATTPAGSITARAGDVAIYRYQYSEEGKRGPLMPVLLSSQEAEGTKKLFYFSALIFDILDNGKTAFIDELDARLHPRLTRKVVELFHNPDTNPRNAQLIFISHDSNLLEASLLRRDQVAFVKKDKFGASELYSLVEFKGVRNTASFEKEYLMGKYGAVPNNLNVVEEAVENYLTNAQADKANKKDG